MDLKPVSDAANSSRLIFTPNPVTLDGQRNIAAELQPGETLAAFLARNVPEDMGYGWEVRINGVVVPHEVMPRVRPKPGTVIEVRSLVKKQALYIVAMAVLTYFTMGAGATIGGFLGATAGAATAINIAVFVAGSAIINKVLGPKPPEPQRESRDSVYSIGKARNQPRPYQPLPLLFGRVRIAPDVLSLPYMWHEGNDQYMGMVLTPGLNVERVDALDNGDTPLASFEAVQVYHAGFPAMPEQAIPLYSNADTVQGGELFKPDGRGRHWVERATPADTVRIQINLEYLLGDKTSKGRPHPNRATVEVQYRKTGTSAWQPLVSRTFVNSDFNPKRATLSADVPRGQYDVRVSRSGAAQEAEGQNGRAQFQWTNMTAVQADDTDYSAIPRIGVRMKATGQLNGAPDELRCVAYSKPCPVWKGGQWVTEHTSNPGAHMLAYIRGIRDAGGKLLAGMGLPDAMIDVAAFQAFMVHCAENNYTYDYWVRDARSHDEMLSALALVGMGQYTWASGKLSVAWAAQNQPVSGVVNMATIKRASFQVDYTLANAADGIEYTYFDAEKWDTGIVRIAAPGQQDALNPARISGEGIARAEHAAELARWHLAQSLYQYKDISYSTDLEHLSYRRLSLLQLQHDLTQWGYGGRVVAVDRNGGAVTLTLDEAVPAPSAGNAYIGIRPLGERNCRVMRVAAFSGESRTIRLAEAWPADVPLPATPEDAQNLLWIYDFKQTPGYRVRVVGIQPEPGLKGAQVSVVPESPEYWHYVKTGEYQRPANQSLLQPRPVVESLRVTEAQIEQGDTVFTELQADWTASGQVAYFTVHAAKQTQGQWADMVQVAETRSTTARFRIHEAGTYKITVRPYNADGIVGGVRTVTYATSGADTAPPMFDYASVEMRGGGVRAYLFGYSTTVQPGNYAGAEIRYTGGSHNAPDWDAMTPLGGDGFFTANTEATVPESGQWTVAFRPRNTSGLLGDARIVLVNLGGGLGETIGDVDGRIDEHTQQLVHAQQERDRIARESLERDMQESLDRTAAIADAAANEAQARTAAIASEAQARADALLAQKLVLQTEISRVEQQSQSADESMALSIAQVAAGSGTQFDVAKIWRFDADAEGWFSSQGAAGNQDGWLRPADGNDPYIESPAVAIAGQAYRYVKARIKRVGTPPWEGALFWKPAGEPWRYATAHQIPEPTFDSNGTAVVEWSDIAWWPNEIERIRLDLSHSASVNDYYLIDWIAIGRPSPGAGVALVEQKEQASIERDAANTLKTNLLAAQLRGDYEGTDAGQLSQGLLYSEQQARVAADHALAHQHQVLSAQINDPASGLPHAHARISEVDEARVSDRDAATQRMANMQADINGRATAGAVDAVTVRVNKIGGGGNLLPNSGFERNADNWRTLWNQHNIQPHVLVRDLSGPYWIPTGLHAIGQYVSTLLPQGAHIVAVAEPIPVEPGKTYCFAGHIAQHRCDSGVGIQFLSADYSQLLSEPTNVVAGAINGGPKIADWRRVHVSGVAPAGAVWAQPAHWMRGREQANPFAWLCQPMFCELAEGQTEPPPYAPGGNELAGDFASEVQRINSIHSAVTDPATGLARAHGRVDDLAQVVADNARTSSQRIINVESSLNTVRNGAGGGNLLRNSTFERDLAGWVHGAINSPAQPVRNAGAPDWQPTGINTLALRSATQPPAGGYAEMFSERVPVSGGETVAASLYAAAQRCTARAWIIVRGADGNWAHSYPLGHSTAAGGADLRDWARISTVVQLPPDARSVQLLFRQSDATAADPVAWMCQPMLCRVLPGATDAPPYAPGGNEHAQAVLELKTEVDTAQNERRAIAGLYVNANGKIGGFRTISDGVTARFDVSADIFTVTSDAAQGLEWQAGCMRSYNGVSQAVLGHGFGETNDLALYIGPNTGRTAARKQDATLWADTAGNAGFSGVVHGAVISGSALTLESLRIRVGDGKYAPFTICDTASDFVNHTAGTRVMTSTCSGFVAPDNGAGYHHKRFGRHRQDVQMHINLHTDHGWEDVVLEVQYNGGGWQIITHTSIDGGYRNSATYLVRYTTIDSWQTVAFRARTVRGKTTCLTLRIDIANYNESGNPPGSHSNMFSPGGTGGQTPAPPPPPPREPRPPRNGIWEQEP